MSYSIYPFTYSEKSFNTAKNSKKGISTENFDDYNFSAKASRLVFLYLRYLSNLSSS